MRLHFVRHRGFTLVELMVAIAIIGILSSILYANFSDARAQARDKQRMVSLKEVQLALELYKAQNGRYPASGCSSVSTFCGPGPRSPVLLQCPGGGSCNSTAPYINGLVPEFIPSLPIDPISENTMDLGYYYRTDTGGTMYKLMIRGVIEDTPIAAGSEFAVCPSASPCAGATAIGNAYTTSIGVYSPGAETW